MQGMYLSPKARLWEPWVDGLIKLCGSPGAATFELGYRKETSCLLTRFLGKPSVKRPGKTK